MPPSQVSVPCVRLGCPTILRGVLVVLCFRFFVFTVAPKALPCVGFHHPLPLWNDFTLLCSAALRYSSLMFQNRQGGTFGKTLEYPLWFLRAIPPPFRCCLLAPPPPSSVLGVPVSVFGPAPAALPPLPLPLRPYLLLDVCVSCSPSC